MFRKSLLNFIRPSANKIYNINDTFVIKLISRLRLGFGDLREHKFKHNFQDTLNPALRATLANDLKNICSDIPTFRHENLTNISLCGYQIYDDKTNQTILMHAIKDLINLFLIRPILLVTAYTFDTVSHFNTR